MKMETANDSQSSPKRRKLEDKNESPKQVDAHIKTFLESIFKNAGKNGASENAREALASAVSKTLGKRRRNVPRRDASTQTEEESVEDQFPERPQQPPSPTSLLTVNAAAYYASTANNIGYLAPSNTDLQYYTTISTNPIAASQLPSTELRQQLSIWDQSYQRWFKESFGVDIESVPLETARPQTNIQVDSDASRAVACQTPLVPNNPVISAQPVIYAAQPVINPISTLLSAQMAAQNLLYFYAQQQLKQQQEFMAAAMVSSLTAIPRPIVCFPSTKSVQPQVSSPTPSSSSQVPIDSSELSGHVTQYGAYGVLRSCPLDVMETQEGPDSKDADGDGELPVYTTPEDYRSRLQTWMPPRPPLGLLLRKQTLICVVTVPIQSKVYEIEVRKKAPSKTPVNIDYVSALETIVEKNAKVKVTYVFNRINRLPDDAQSAFLHGFRETDNDEIVTLENLPTTDPMHNLEVPSNSNGNVVAIGPTAEPTSQVIDNSLDVEEVILDDKLHVEVSPACEAHSRDMYICDLLIGDVLICQALADCKMQAKICSCRKALYLLSKPTFVVGGIRTWYGNDESPIDYLTFCLSLEAKRVPRLMPYLADPLVPIPSEQPICPKDPAETFKVCTPKPIHDLWLYTARPIAVNVDELLAPEQYLAQSAEFSQMTVNFEVEFDSSTGKFTAFGLVDGQRCVRAPGNSVPVARAAASSRLLQYLKLSQPVVGLLLPPPDPDDLEDLEMANDDSMNPLWGLTEASIVDSLMWGKHEKQFALPIEHLEAHCEILSSSSSEELDKSFNSGGSSFFLSRRHLDQYLEAYAASALVAPLRISLQALPHSLWHLARSIAHSWGLLTLIEFEIPDHLNTAFLLVCKRAPLPRLKRTLFEKTEAGVFYLLSKGNLPPEALKTISSADLLESPTNPESQTVNILPEPSSPQFEAEDELPYVDENDPLTRMARTFHATSSIVKTEAINVQPSVSADDPDVFLVSAELNQHSNAVEILDDLPKQLIPGIDF
ncbi:unnamed protein product [Rodentolepis nana]|uniref:ULP_PROTEASE domain-containing protein n=1 Tax=Rodentolepis nana TaxID=102285 RepID=A0A0R3TMT6_RODNA|nr:unnamed protein product [Rodentolepis nana]